MSNNSYYNDQWRIINEPNQNKVSNYSMSFNGTSDFINLGDSNNFSFGNGVTDLPFSISAWINMTDATKFRLLTKADSTPREYVFYTAGNDKLYFILYDNGGNTNYIGRLYDTALTSFENQWVHLTATYDGSSSSTGIKIYLNGTRVDDTDVNVGSYTAMINTSQDVYIGNFKNLDYANGKIDQVTVFDYALPATGTNSVATLYGGGTAVTNPMSLSPKPIAYYQLGDQSAYNGANYLVPNNSLSDYVFNFLGNSRINLPASVSLGSASTISMWVKLTGSYYYGLLGENTYGSSSSKYTLFIDTTKLYFRIESGYVQFTKSSKITSGNWHHILITRDGNSVQLWIDNQLEGTTSSWSGTNAGTQSTRFDRIGARHGSNLNPVVGEISNVAGWNQKLNNNEITEVYNNGAPGDISSLSPIAWYKLNAADTFDGSDWTINDYGSGGNDGTSDGMDSSNLVLSDLTRGTSGHSPYALSLDGIDDYLDCGDSDTFSFGNGSTDSPFSISAWVNMADATTFRIVSKTGTNGHEYFLTNGGDDKLNFILYDTFGTGDIRAKYDTALTSYESQWIHVVGTYSGVNGQNGIELYLNGSLLNTVKILNAPYTAMGNTTQPLEIARSASSSYASGKFSNVSVFNTELTSTQVLEIYNQGLPSNLHNFSGTAPVSWWQIGSNSSYNSGTWTCLDEIGTDNAVSAGSMTNSDIVDGVGYSAIGLGTSSIDIKGDAPYSTSNGISQGGMDVLDRSTDVAPS